MRKRRPRTDEPPPPPAEELRRFERVYTDNYARILGYLVRRTSSADDAADVLAETFLTAWRRLDQVPEGVETRLWLYGVARRTLANHRRREQRRSAATERLRAELASAPLAGHDDPPELATVGRALRSMPPNDQELLGLVAWEGLDNGEVAAVLGCSRNAARIRLHRARRRLERELRSAGGDAGERGQRGRTLSVAGPTTPTPEGDRL